MSCRSSYPGCTPLYSLRETGCGCPLDTSAKQKHRPSRQARPRTFEVRMGSALDGIKETSRFLIASSINRDRSSRLDVKCSLIQKMRSPIWMTSFFILKERETGLEPATPTLARWCSTN